MATKTRADLIKRVLELLGVVGAGQPIPPEEYNAVDGLVEEAVDSLALKHVINIDDIGAIEPAVFQPLARWIANMGGAPWGVVFDAGVERQTENTLRHIAATAPGFLPQKTEYY